MTRTLTALTLFTMLVASLLCFHLHAALNRIDRLEQAATINAANIETLREVWNLRHNERVTFMVEVTE